MTERGTHLIYDGLLSERVRHSLNFTVSENMHIWDKEKQLSPETENSGPSHCSTFSALCPPRRIASSYGKGGRQQALIDILHHAVWQ